MIQSILNRPAISLLVFSVGVCLFWLLLFPISGDGDAVMHFENFREGQQSIKSILHPWARPLYAAFNIPASYLGMMPSRLFHLLLGAIMAWQTYRYAKDLQLKYAYLAIPFALLQPYATLLSSDTMTETPFALMAVVIARLWHHQRYLWVSILVGLSPLVRPEGFFFGLFLGLLFLTYKPTGIPLIKRWLILSTASLGVILWLVAGKIWAHDWLYVVNSWPWGGELNYGSGSILHYPISLLQIIGLVFIVPWLIGSFFKPLEKKMIPNQFLWWSIFLTHTILWWGGWMGSAGLLRIIACVTPFAAITCVKGWGILMQYWQSKQSFWIRKPALSLSIYLLIAAAYSIGYNYICPSNQYGRITRTLSPKFISLIEKAPAIVTSDPAMISITGLDPFDKRIQSNFSNKTNQHKLMRSLPQGSVCHWDNQRGHSWFHMTCEELEDLGYKIIQHHEHKIFPSYYFYPVKLEGVIAVKVTPATKQHDQ